MDNVIKYTITEYFEKIRKCVKDKDTTMYFFYFREFSGYIRGLKHAKAIDNELYDKLFDIANNYILEI